MKKKLSFLITFGLLYLSVSLLGQGIDFTIKYNTTDNLYEVYGKAEFTLNGYFVGGGSQLSIVFPNIVLDEPLEINSINGGLWSDNSQVFEPAITPDVDYHGIASNGSQVNWISGAELLLFTFAIPNTDCTDGLRLFENGTDPNSSAPGMDGSDFQNYFVNVLTFENHYRSNYDNAGTACSKPVIDLNPINVLVNTVGKSCATIINSNLEAIHDVTICGQGLNGEATIAIDSTSSNNICLYYQPNLDYVGPDSVCVLVCDDLDNCFQTNVQINVFENTNCSIQTASIITGNSLVCFGADILLTTNSIGNNFTYNWTNANGVRVGQGDTLILSSTNLQAIPPFQVTRIMQSCPDVISIPYEVEIINFNNLQIENQVGMVCSGGDVEIFTSGLQEGNYRWYNNLTNQLVSVVAHPTFTNIQEDLSLRLEVDYKGCTNQNEPLFTTIQIAEEVTISDIPRTITVCRGEDVLLTPTPDAAIGGEVRYFWEGPADFSFKNTTTNDSFPLFLDNITPEQAGAYSIDITTQNGCEVDSRSIIVNVTDDLETPSLNAAQDVVCSGETIALRISIQNGEGLSFEWYKQNSADDLELIGETNIPSLIIEEATISDAGKYLVRLKSGECVSGYSNIELIKVLENTRTLGATNTTNPENKACIGDFVQLSVPFYEGATYKWFGPAGFKSDIYNPIINITTSFNAGDYFAVISVNDCPGVVTQSTEVFVQETPTAPVIKGNSQFCEGESLKLSVQNDNNLMTIWYNAATGRVVDTTLGNQLTIPQITIQYAGTYYATFVEDGCSSEPSNSIDIKVIGAADLQVNAGNDAQYCAATFITLRASAAGNSFGQWSTTTGATIADPESSSTTATDLRAGENIFVYTVQNICGHRATDTTIINVLQAATIIANAGVDIEVCESNTIMLSATNVANTIGNWSLGTNQANQNILIQNSNNPTATISGLEAGNVYKFNWTLSTAECPNFSKDEVIVTVDERPEELAFISSANQEIAACDSMPVIIQAEPSLFSLGQWTGTDGIVIFNPFEAETTVENLPTGTSTFIWTLSSGICKKFSSDTLTVYQPPAIEANADQYEINLNDSLNFNVFENDKVPDLEHYRFVISKYPDNGTLREEIDGTITYIPQTNYFGADNFRYKLCDLICESVCDTAMVNLLVSGGDGASGICFIPNVVTPNNDGVNDQFLIGCLNEFPETSVKIFNRWGDVVHEASPYLNNWEGTFKGKPVPAGTYYYYLKLEPDSEPIQSFFSIFR